MKKTIVFSCLILLCMSFYGSYLESNNQRPNGVYELITIPHRGLQWLSHKEPVSIPTIPTDTLSYYYGSRIQRTMSLLETSTSKKRNKVKILFYGQSIIGGLNSKSIIDKLKKRYPYAIIKSENRAIGSFTAPHLVRTAIHDLYPFYPDLLIFHVYNGEDSGELERIIYNTRKYTTSEILLLNHHYAYKKDSIEQKKRNITDQNSSMYWNFLAQKYGCELVNIRDDWKKFIDQNPQISINTLMGDTSNSDVHPNKKGQKLMELLILKHLKFNPIGFNKFNRGWFNEIRDYDLKRFSEEKQDEVIISGNSKQQNSGVIIDSATIQLSFIGNKVELISDTSINGNFGSVDILIDGVKPSNNINSYYSTRPSNAYFDQRPALKRVTLNGLPKIEKWKLIITKINYKTKKFSYKVIGEKTGFDGTGTNTSLFISNSGILKIEPSDFFVFESFLTTQKTIPNNFEINWKIKPLFSDTINFTSKDPIQLITQGITNQKHQLTITHNGNNDGFPIKAIRIYKPPLND